MSKAYAAQAVAGTGSGEDKLLASTTVYADSLEEAKLQAVRILGYPPNQLRVAVIPDIHVPSDDEVRSWNQTEQEFSTQDIAQQMRNQ
jgi:hypothetical protein